MTVFIDLLLAGRSLTKRQLETRLDYSDKTVKHAIDHLVSLGIVSQVGRRGYAIDPHFRLFLLPYLLGRDPGSTPNRPKADPG